MVLELQEDQLRVPIMMKKIYIYIKDCKKFTHYHFKKKFYIKRLDKSDYFQILIPNLMDLATSITSELYDRGLKFNVQ